VLDKSTFYLFTYLLLKLSRTWKKEKQKIGHSYGVSEPIRADLDVLSGLEWIYKVLDEHRWTTQLTGVDPEDVVVLAEHHGAVARTSPYETLSKPHVNLQSQTTCIVTKYIEATAAYHICSVISLLWLEDILLRTLLPVITAVVPAN